ncbi:MAG: UbiD family decarboxylase [Bacteroidetes bacterium]|jgi:4-hydroxy-3-polyprenylbenzoate decarboxylase|nr:UbiD family decarboxylase [Bacteroidota bacterium]
MGYKSLEECILDLEKHGHLIRVTEEVDPNLEMAAIHLRVHEAGGPALLFENVKGCKFRAASNIFGTKERAQFIFRDSIENVKKLVDVKSDPLKALRHPLENANTLLAGLKSIPKKSEMEMPVMDFEIKISDLPQIKHWPDDGGAFVTLPAVYSEDIDQPGIMNSNLGMYRIQLSGNDYVKDKEIGLHYQLHRGIGIHQSKAIAKNQPLKVSIFVGGPPSIPFSAVMPLPEGLSELTFAGVLGNRKFHYAYQDGYCIATEADFVITGEIYPEENKLEGPFGDHFGYYSLKHPFPMMRVHKVWHRENAIWPFTVVGRPPQEDTSFGWLVHELAGKGLEKEIPGLKSVHAVDAAGVHPLLLAIGSERYTPYSNSNRPSEILTIANHILGSGQLSLAKYLFISSFNDNPQLDIHNIPAYFKHIFERIDLRRDIHFYTNTSIDTLDYSGSGLNAGSKVVFAAAGPKVRELKKEIPELNLPDGFENAKLIMPGFLSLKGPKFISYENAEKELSKLTEALSIQKEKLDGFPLIILCDDSDFVSKTINNFLWATFTRSNPSHDIYGVKAVTEHKHWSCEGPLIIDSRTKPHHAPPLEKDPTIEKQIERFFAKGGSLEGIKN